VSLIPSFHCHGVVIGSIPQNLRIAGEFHAHAECPVAVELVKAMGSQVDGHQGHVDVVHRLKLDSSVTTVPGGLIQEIIQRLQHLSIVVVARSKDLNSQTQCKRSVWQSMVHEKHLGSIHKT